MTHKDKMEWIFVIGIISIMNIAAYNTGRSVTEHRVREHAKENCALSNTPDRCNALLLEAVFTRMK